MGKQWGIRGSPRGKRGGGRAPPPLRTSGRRRVRLPSPPTGPLQNTPWPPPTAACCCPALLRRFHSACRLTGLVEVDRAQPSSSGLSLYGPVWRAPTGLVFWDDCRNLVQLGLPREPLFFLEQELSITQMRISSSMESTARTGVSQCSHPQVSILP